jgi:hypothetical protein
MKAENIKQGQIGNCYFVASLCAMVAKEPKNISKLFLTKEMNKAGIYIVQVYLNGR